MSGLFTLANVVAYNAQIIGIVAVAALLLRLLPLPAAGARYGAWRFAVVIALLLPWMLRSTPPPRMVSASPVIEAAAVDVSSDAAIGAPLLLAPEPVSQPIPWATVLPVVMAAGIALRAWWLAIGLWRLRGFRVHGANVDDEAYAERQRMLKVHARIASVTGLKQPVTFGVWRPVVLVPESLSAAPESQRLAVITHELLHVQRRDWCWLLGEELLRTVLWFQPAIWWATSRIQLAREELVDELTVLATGNRRAYIEALLAFADGGRLRPAQAFARRRFLFTRIVRLSKERVMSAPRIIVSTAAIVAAVLGAGWYAGTAFPILAAAPAVAATDQPLDAASPAAAGQADVQSAVPRDGSPAPIVKVPAPTISGPDVFIRDLQERGRAATEHAKLFMPPQGARNGGAPRPGPAVSAGSQATNPPATKPITPENPIPRRLSAPSIDYPAQLHGSGARGSVVVRVVLDASGSVSEVTRVSSNVVTADNAGMGPAMQAFLTAAVDGVRLWRYAPPAEAPIAFFVQVAFFESGPALTKQTESPSLIPLPDGASPRPLDLVALQARLAVLRAEQESLAQRLNERHPDRLRNQQQIAEL
ncbi:MAG TPA: M56 family metallopeptidase, partial [Vicinamibacterales bacterium]|nr:M56 family metallopeptidase [Vicinamibacterales bacterium]